MGVPGFAWGADISARSTIPKSELRDPLSKCPKIGDPTNAQFPFVFHFNQAPK